MLNVFLAIAVDNLANAQEMTAQQEEAERIAQELKEKCLNSEVTKFLSPEKQEAEGGEKGKDGKDGSPKKKEY